MKVDLVFFAAAEETGLQAQDLTQDYAALSLGVRGSGMAYAGSWSTATATDNYIPAESLAALEAALPQGMFVNNVEVYANGGINAALRMCAAPMAPARAFLRLRLEASDD